MANPTVIIFGPTGVVGSATALKAAELGADVVLAMRNTKKSIPGLDADKERAGRFRRVQADLTNADSVYEAVVQTKAKKAFIYLAHGSDDHMKATILALKRAGIDEVVFLSGAAVRGAIRDIPPEEVIPYVHAQVEINLEEVFGANGFHSIRPASFATNLFWYRQGIQSGTIKINGPDYTVDSIAPEDAGRVSGIALVRGLPGGERKPYLYGPQLLSVREYVQRIAKSLGKELVVESLDKEEEYKDMVEKEGLPPQMARYLVERRAGNGHDDAPLSVLGMAVTEDDLKNIERYSGQPATTFDEWLEQNKKAFE